MTIYLTKSLDGSNDNIGIVGLLVNNGGRGWTFKSLVQQSNGRVKRDTADAAIPKWFKGYVVDAPSTADAITLTKGYRIGYQWADKAASDGLIKIVH